MPRLGWRVRMFTRRAIPHTPAKRWGYGAALILAALALVLGHALAAALVVLAIAAVRLLDLKRSGARRGALPTNRAYFFEGAEDQDPLDRRRRR